jgi:hypothetical protein
MSDDADATPGSDVLVSCPVIQVAMVKFRWSSRFEGVVQMVVVRDDVFGRARGGYVMEVIEVFMTVCGSPVSP